MTDGSLVTPDSVVVFTDASHGDVRGDLTDRARLAHDVGVPSAWSTVEQIHGVDVVRAEASGVLGRADALFTTAIDLPLAVFTADCVGVVLRAPGAVGVAHAGWRGTEAGVVVALRAAMESAGHAPVDANIGPHIRSCCFEVGPEVGERFPEHGATTSWGTPSIDLSAAIVSQLEGVSVTDFGACTYHQPGWFSHRRDADRRRMASLVVRRA